MEAQELRIGNLVEYSINDTFTDRVPYFGKNIFKVVAIFEDSIKIDLGFESAQRVLLSDPKLKPIPLSTDWMIISGFTQVGINFEKGWLLLWKNKSLDTIDFVVNEPYSGKRFARHLRYVHELQNIYQGLNGVELTLERPQTSQPIN